VSESQENNKAQVHRFFEARTKGDLAAVEEMMTPDFVVHHRGSSQARSREGYIRDLTEDRAACSDIHFIIEDQAADGERVLSRFTVRGSHYRGEWRGFAPTGMEFEAPYIGIHRISGTRIAEEWREGGGLPELTQEPRPRNTRTRARRAGIPGGPKHPASLSAQGGAHFRGLPDHSLIPAC
jgi:predicted ester cyclase